MSRICVHGARTNIDREQGAFLGRHGEVGKKQPYFSLFENKPWEMIYANVFTNQNKQFQTWGQAGTVLPGRGCQDTGRVGGDPT